MGGFEEWDVGIKAGSPSFFFRGAKTRAWSNLPEHFAHRNQHGSKRAQGSPNSWGVTKVNFVLQEPHSIAVYV